MSVECSLHGINELLQKFNDLAINSNNAQKNALNNSADELVGDVKQTTKFKDDTGKLRKSIKKSNVKTNKYGKYIWVGDVDGETDYSWFVEYGRSGGPNGYVAPTHFLKGTLLEESDKLQNMMIQDLKRELGVK